MKVRRKTINFEGLNLTIGALTYDQIETYLAPVDELQDPKKTFKVRNLDIVALSLNNVREDSDGEWTAERVRVEFDLLGFNHVLETILQFSGLELRKKEGIPMGESPAAPEPAA